MKAVSCDIAVACASMLPADPLQVGTDTGDIAPQDLFNPILYKACTNDSFNTVVNRIYSMSDVDDGASLATPGTVGNDPWSGTINNSSDIYYSLLSEDGWKKAMPQSGFAMKGIRPLVYPILSTYGNTRITAPSVNVPGVNVVGSDGVDSLSNVNQQFRGPAQPMPSVPTTVFRNTQNVTDDHPFDVFTMNNPGIPKTFVACIVTPPSVLHVLYYRLRITWTLEFSDPITSIEKATLGTLTNNGSHLHQNLQYVPSSKDTEYLEPENLPTQDDLVDVRDASLTKILEK
uniref:Capsid protein n=1 Tax=Cressdnaviricota sp. TaxID=2748378 RepID=A0A8E7YY97_9VIRU|nr:capsid protein [Cressdnaviricota sp.]